MTERTFRVFLGAGLFFLLYLSALNGRTDLLMYYIALLVFEGITNWRIPGIVTAIKHKMTYNKPVFYNRSLVSDPDHHFSIPFEAERAMRLVVALFLLAPGYFSLDFLWILPWFVASMLLLAGVTNICPMVMFFRWMGFK